MMLADLGLDPYKIDKAIAAGFGMPMGPFRCAGGTGGAANVVMVVVAVHGRSLLWAWVARAAPTGWLVQRCGAEPHCAIPSNPGCRLSELDGGDIGLHVGHSTHAHPGPPASPCGTALTLSL